MTGTVVNMLLVIIGSAVGLFFRSRIRQSLMDAIISVLGLAVLVIGISGAVKTEDLLCLIICLALGTFAGECMEIEKRLDSAGDALQGIFKRFTGKGEGRFTEGFVSASIMYCVGSMAVMGSLEAGVNGNYTILISKGIIDGVISVAFAAAMGVGVAFSALSVGIYQGSLTLLAEWAAPYLSQKTVTGISAVGSVVIIGIAVNMLELGNKRLRVGNMLPAVFLPLVYLPLADWFANFLKTSITFF